MAKNRIGRVAEEIKKELGFMIQNGLKDPRIGFVTVTGVEVTNDLSQAKVYVSIFGDDAKRSESLKGLQNAAGHMRSELAKKIKVRHIPELLFKLDVSIDYGMKIEKIISQIHQDSNEEKR